MFPARQGDARRADRLERRLLPILVCPICKGEILSQMDQQRILCPRCAVEYPIVRGVPIMMDLATRATLRGLGAKKKSRGAGSISILDRIKQLAAPPSPSLNTSRMARRMLADLGTQADILDLGSGTHRLAEHVVNLDIDLFSNVDIVAIGQALPFRNSSSTRS